MTSADTGIAISTGAAIAREIADSDIVRHWLVSVAKQWKTVKEDGKSRPLIREINLQ